MIPDADTGRDQVSLRTQVDPAVHAISRLSISTLLSCAAVLGAALPATSLAASRRAAGPRVTSSLGVIVGTSGNSVHVELPGGSMLNATLPAAVMTYMHNQGEINACEIVTLAFHPAARGDVLSSFTPIAISTSPAIPVNGGGTCATQSDGGLDVVGPITQISKTSVTVATLGLGNKTFRLDPSTLVGGGNVVGDIVDLTFAPTGNPLANNIQTTEAFLTGTVTRVGSSSLTVRNLVGGHSTTFERGQGAFAHIRRGNQVGVLYWVNGGVPQADTVSDFSSGATN
jgi:hypothetical protein